MQRIFWWVRKDEFPSLNLPILPSSIAVPIKKKSPRKQSEDVADRSASDEEGGPAPVQDFVCDQCCSTELTIVDIKHMEEKIWKQLIELRTKNESLKFTLANIADNDKRVAFYTGFSTYAALMACFKFLGLAVSELIYWNSNYMTLVKWKRRVVQKL